MKKIMMLLIIMIISLMLTVNASTKTIVTDGLVSYWTFDQDTIRGGKVMDVWGKNDATLVGNPKSVDGYVNSGIELDGKGDYVRLPNVGNFGSQVGAYTFEVWLKTTQKKEWSAIYRVLEKGCAGANNGVGILINAKAPQDGRGGIITKEGWMLFERSMNRRENHCHTNRISKEFPISDGEWHHIVFMTQSATEEDKDRLRHFKGNLEDCIKLELYINTKQRSDFIFCISPQDFVAYEEPIFLGAMNSMGEASRFFEGVFDEVRIYDRALTEEEVIHNYESGIGLGVDAVEKLPTVWGALKEKH